MTTEADSGYFPDLNFISDQLNSNAGWGEFTDWEYGWGAFILLSIFLVIFFYTLVYMLSYVVRNEELKRSARAQFMDVLFTAGLATSAIVIMTGVFTSLQSYYTGATVSCDMYGTIQLDSGAGPFNLIKCKLQEKASYITEIYEHVYVGAREPFKELQFMWGLVGIPIYMYGAYIGSSGISALYTEVENYRMLANVCITLLIGINGYIVATDYIYMNMIRMFLPIGIVLRSIPFTRNIGAFFMALGLGFYIVFPFVYVVTDPTFVKASLPYVDLSDTSSIDLPWPSFQGAIAIATIGPETTTDSQAFGTTDIKSLASQLSKLYYGIMFQPVVALSVTLIFVRYFTSVLGGETQELYRLASKVI